MSILLSPLQVAFEFNSNLFFFFHSYFLEACNLSLSISAPTMMNAAADIILLLTKDWNVSNRLVLKLTFLDVLIFWESYTQNLVLTLEMFVRAHFLVVPTKFLVRLDRKNWKPVLSDRGKMLSDNKKLSSGQVKLSSGQLSTVHGQLSYPQDGCCCLALLLLCALLCFLLRHPLI